MLVREMPHSDYHVRFLYRRIRAVAGIHGGSIVLRSDHCPVRLVGEHDGHVEFVSYIHESIRDFRKLLPARSSASWRGELVNRVDDDEIGTDFLGPVLDVIYRHLLTPVLLREKDDLPLLLRPPLQEALVILEVESTSLTQSAVPEWLFETERVLHFFLGREECVKSCVVLMLRHLG